MPLPPNYRRVPLKPLSGGVKLDRNPSLLLDGQTPNALNVEFSNESVRSARGSRKFNNQAMPQPAVECRPDPAYSPLSIEPGKSVPLRGYVFWPYDRDNDIGGDFVSAGSFPSETYHLRRGRSFELQVSVRIPETFKMFEMDARGENAPNVASQNAGIGGGSGPGAGIGYDEGLDDCCLILQKGGDRTAPLTWALGIVNAGKWEEVVGVAATGKARKSNYFFVFMWLDSAEWGAGTPANMRYHMTDPSQAGTSGLYSTQALRAFILDGRDDTVAYALEPGLTYNVSLSVTLDTASIGGSSWNHNGRVDFRAQEQHGRLFQGSFVDSGGGGTTTNLSLFKGPTDSLRYLAKYGIRYSGRDAVHIGLGYRTSPWNAQGFIPYGMDSAAMEHKGFRLADCSNNTVDDLYGAAAYSLTCQHAAGNSYLSLNAHRGLTEGGTSWAQAPLGPLGGFWSGYGGPTGDGGAPASNFNSEALRGYRVVFPKGSVNATFAGGVMEIEGYSEVAVNDYRLETRRAEVLATVWATEQPFLIRAFRWNQQALAIQEVRLWSSSRDYADPRVAFSLRSSLDLADPTEPNLDRLQAYLPLNDAGGRVCRELVRGKSAYFAPISLALEPRGNKGESSLFLSGEGDALTYDLSEHPVFQRELRAMQQSNARGFAIEITCTIPEAHYGVAVLNANPNRQGFYDAAYCPDIASWAVKNADEAGSPSSAAPILTMGHHSFWAQATGTTPERRPQGFHVDVHTGLDGESVGMTTAVLGFTRSAGGPGNWDDTAPWVGRRITLQVGVQPSPANRANTAGKQNEYRVYIAATPKGDLKFAAGENPQAEFAYYADTLIQKKDLLRLVVTIGGGWNPTLARGYTEHSLRLIVHEARIYGATASGELPATAGNVTNERRGKILGRNSLPQRTLEPEDILQPLGVGTRTAALTEGSASVAAPGGTSFFTQLPETTLDSVREKFLVALSDEFALPSLDGLQDFIQEFYWIQSVAANGLSLTLATPYNGPSSARGAAACINLIGYTVFDRTEDDLVRSPLSLGAGPAYKPGTTRTKDLTLSDVLFRDRSPIGGDWKVRIASPFTQGGLATVLPRWVRGVVTPRRGEITGLHALDSTVFAANLGCVARMDDRWREDGPTSTLKRSLYFGGRSVAGHEQRWPLVLDGARFSPANAWPYWTTTISRGYTWVYDFRIWLEDYAELQTLAWLGCEYSHLQRGPAAQDNQRGIGFWFRLANGRPEIVHESAGTFVGGSGPPPDGRYIASSGDRVPLRTWVSIRFYVENYLDGANDAIRVPGILINGRPTRVQVNAVETGLSGTTPWVRTLNGGGLIGTASDTRNVYLLGVARDSVRTNAKAQFTTVSQLGGQEFPATRISGPMHPLVGRMAGAVVWRALTSDGSVNGYPAYNPETFDYAGRLVRFRADLQEGVGEKLVDARTDTTDGSATVTPGLVLSHPAIDLFNEFGTRRARPSMVAAGNRVYLANGGRVAQVTERAGGPAGIIPPTTKPTVTVERKPLWEPNFADGASTEQDPIAQAAVGAGAQIYHYSTRGNSYLSQKAHEDMKWAKDDAPTPDLFDVLALKFYWHPRSITGRIPLWSARGSLDSGGLYLDCVDGGLELGWYDTSLKKRVSVATSAPVFRPGYWYHVNLRKAFPMQDAQEGNWLNSFWSAGRRRRSTFTIGVAGWAVGDVVRNGGVTKQGVVTKVYAGTIEYVLFQGHTDFVNTEAVNNGSGATGTITQTPYHMTGDALIVREFGKSTVMLDHPPWTMKPGQRCAISFTSGMPRSTGTTGIGQVSPKGTKFNGAVSGVVTVAAATNIAVFHADMIGMYFQFGAVITKLYRISAVTSDSQATVVDEFGVTPDLSTVTAQDGAVFSGVELVKSPEFNSSKTPDQALYDIEFMGSSLAVDPSNGLAKNEGKFASFGWVVVACGVDAFYSNVHVFETATPADHCEIGTDSFADRIFTATRPGETHFDSTRAFAVVDGQPYAGGTAASTQPNAALQVAMDTEADADAEALLWKYIEEPVDIEGKRFVQVVFYDADQNVRSNPGPKLVVEVAPEDKANPSGNTRLMLAGLPVSHQPGRIERWIYMSEPDSVVLFRQAIVPDNISGTVSLELDANLLEREEVLAYDNAPPPDCAVLGVSQEAMFYGDITISGVRQSDLIRHSKPFFPTQVPFSNKLALISGTGERITAMADVDGTLLVWKRDALIGVVLREGRAFRRTTTQNVGAPGPQAVAVLDQEAYWVSTDRGFYAYLGGSPVWLGENVSPIFEGTSELFHVERSAVELVSVAVNRTQDQVVAALRAESELDHRRRVALEFDSALSGLGVPGDPGNGFRFTLYAGPNLTTLGAADRMTAGPQHFLGGTAEGFVAYLDREDSQVELADPAGTLQVTLTSGSTTSKLVLSVADATLVGLEGLRGAPLAWLEGGVEKRATVLFSDGNSIWLDRLLASAPPNGTVVSIGAIPFSWSSKWLDLGRPEERKIPEYVDLVMTPQASGTAVLEAFVDFGTTPQQLRVNGVNVSAFTMDLTQALHRIPTNELRGQFVQLRIRLVPPAVNVRIEVTELVVRLIEAESH